MKGFEDSALPTPSLGRKFMDRFLKKVAIVRKSYQGCHSLEGNQSRDFLNKIDLLQLEIELENQDIVDKSLPYLTAFRSFSEVVSSCFGVYLKNDYREKIDHFKTSYMALGLNGDT